eukprot:TRINITY_DN4220_c0_g1_i1.p1 TRINITY_DN4220_c0_g1~~TRINITY_DN4220_c0_g1_i1.p1  ORF type:complete len:185 (-),score=52.38 TRINITY_DN4220_c0_g1_i1:259-813(-)
MSLTYIDHQRTRFWRTHEEIFDFRRNRDNNWLSLQQQQTQRADERRRAREERRYKWEDEREKREAADREYRAKREGERMERSRLRLGNDDDERRSNLDSRRKGKWSQHTYARQKFRDRQAERIAEEQKNANLEYEALRKRTQDLAARQLVREDRNLRQEQQAADEAASRKAAFEQSERAALKGE